MTLETLEEVEYLDPSNVILVFDHRGNVTYVYIMQRLIKMNGSPTIDAFVDPETTNELETIVVIKIRVAVVVIVELYQLCKDVQSRRVTKGAYVLETLENQSLIHSASVNSFLASPISFAGVIFGVQCYQFWDL